MIMFKLSSTNNSLIVCIIYVFAAFFMGCEKKIEEKTLQEGDLLFQDLDCGELCDAIEAVTEGVDNHDFSHCALVASFEDTLKVIEAIGEKVQINSIEDFFARSGDTSNIQNITIGRLKPNFKVLIPHAIVHAKEMIGLPYDNNFLINNGKWYCSELIYEVFKKANHNNDFFYLSDMTFKDPNTHQYFPAWVDYYKSLKIEIPEGKQGINPGSISRSDKIDIINVSTKDNLIAKF